jgi:hypothetical protein
LLALEAASAGKGSHLQKDETVAWGVCKTHGYDDEPQMMVHHARSTEGGLFLQSMNVVNQQEEVMQVVSV